MKVCSTCNRESQDYVEFRCPKCGKTRIVRCENCRKTAKPYKCEECGFEGP
ncbi:MAG: RNA-binding protein [Candidatus Diapherotrites archaeon]|uniref:RNA-binding protein n=1 Tax=Candidatus Iainarchaeum sp. TaxID=3101447 RepID=A0A938YSK0_9ARCH|nr:RNA-binding protein [Candidatus Diapherotrites archaeon]